MLTRGLRTSDSLFPHPFGFLGWAAGQMLPLQWGIEMGRGEILPHTRHGVLIPPLTPTHTPPLPRSGLCSQGSLDADTRGGVHEPHVR